MVSKNNHGAEASTRARQAAFFVKNALTKGMFWGGLRRNAHAVLGFGYLRVVTVKGEKGPGPEGPFNGQFFPWG
jgi:hypothetical protein